MRHIGNLIVSMLSLLSSSSGGHQRGGQGAAGTDPFSLRREIMTFRFGPERGKKGGPPSGTHARGRGDSNSRKQCQHSDWKPNSQEAGPRHSYNVLGAIDNAQFGGWLGFNQTHLNHPQCSRNNDNFSPCLFPETFKTVSITMCKYDPSRQWTVLNWNTLIKSPLTI